VSLTAGLCSFSRLWRCGVSPPSPNKSDVSDFYLEDGEHQSLTKRHLSPTSLHGVITQETAILHYVVTDASDIEFCY